MSDDPFSPMTNPLGERPLRRTIPGKACEEARKNMGSSQDTLARDDDESQASGQPSLSDSDFGFQRCGPSPLAVSQWSGQASVHSSSIAKGLKASSGDTKDQQRSKARTALAAEEAARQLYSKAAIQGSTRSIAWSTPRREVPPTAAPTCTPVTPLWQSASGYSLSNSLSLSYNLHECEQDTASSGVVSSSTQPFTACTPDSRSPAMHSPSSSVTARDVHINALRSQTALQQSSACSALAYAQTPVTTPHSQLEALQSPSRFAAASDMPTSDTTPSSQAILSQPDSLLASVTSSAMQRWGVDDTFSLASFTSHGSQPAQAHSDDDSLFSTSTALLAENSVPAQGSLQTPSRSGLSVPLSIAASAPDSSASINYQAEFSGPEAPVIPQLINPASPQTTLTEPPLGVDGNEVAMEGSFPDLRPAVMAQQASLGQAFARLEQLEARQMETMPPLPDSTTGHTSNSRSQPPGQQPAKNGHLKVINKQRILWFVAVLFVAAVVGIVYQALWVQPTFMDTPVFTKGPVQVHVTSTDSMLLAPEQAPALDAVAESNAAGLDKACVVGRAFRPALAPETCPTLLFLLYWGVSFPDCPVLVPVRAHVDATPSSAIYGPSACFNDVVPLSVRQKWAADRAAKAAALAAAALVAPTAAAESQPELEADRAMPEEDGGYEIKAEGVSEELGTEFMVVPQLVGEVAQTEVVQAEVVQAELKAAEADMEAAERPDLTKWRGALWAALAILGVLLASALVVSPLWTLQQRTPSDVSGGEEDVAVGGGSAAEEVQGARSSMPAVLQEAAALPLPDDGDLLVVHSRILTPRAKPPRFTPRGGPTSAGFSTPNMPSTSQQADDGGKSVKSTVRGRMRQVKEQAPDDELDSIGLVTAVQVQEPASSMEGRASASGRRSSRVRARKSVA